jgi:hypothetical protein|tara:strand:+ start:214 stop:540 length:327 start_codon:yes stop_codon:yes gene_type:complete
MADIKKQKQHFIMNFRIHVRMAWKKAAGDKGAILYEYYTWKNEMMRRVRKAKPNVNFYIPMSNVGMRDAGFGMHRETKATTIYKLKRAGLIDYRREIGGAYQICSLNK